MDKSSRNVKQVITSNSAYIKLKWSLNNRPKGRAKQFFAKLSRGLMLPIAILPIAGLLLGIGGAIGANIGADPTGQVFANIFKSMSEVVFANLPILFAIAITITFSKDKGASGFCSLLGFLVFCSTQIPFIQKDATGNVISILWFHTQGIQGITTLTLGMTTLQTSIFGGIVVGALTSVIYNKISTVRLPQILDFFSGIRLVPIVLIPTMFCLSLVFLLFWPWIGMAINWMGQGIQGTSYGFGGFLYGILGRSLMPFGLHHIPIVLAFQTELGGILNKADLEAALAAANVGQDVANNVIESFNNFSKGATVIYGDQNIWNFINSLNYNTLFNGTEQIPVFDWFYQRMGIYAGRFTQDYPTYLGVCMGIGAALIFTSEKSNWRNVSIVIGSSMLVAFFTGITEPLEFTFLFSAPWLYYLVYVPFSGFSYMFMELLNAHVGVGFARGFIDLLIYGALPVLKGTNFYWAFLLAALEGSAIFGIFYFFIKKFDLSTPGRKGNPINLITKKEYHELKNKGQTDKRILNIINLLGGKENIVDVSACATRLRVSIKDNNNISSKDFDQYGSKGGIIKDRGIQLIFGGEASIIADNINEYLNDNPIANSKSELGEDEIKFEIDKSVKKVNVYAPFDGKIISLDQVEDELFSSGQIGAGIAIKPTSFDVYSIIEEGYLTNIFDTKHAYTFKSINDIDILLHLGLDTMNIQKGTFKVKTEIGKINRNLEILKINSDKFKKCKSIISPIVVPDLNGKKIVMHVKNNQLCKKGDLLFTIQ
ncbi:MAG: PTS transporter subunit EIIC [Mycoplasmoidaceae bacterium]